LIRGAGQVVPLGSLAAQALDGSAMQRDKVIFGEVEGLPEEVGLRKVGTSNGNRLP